MLIDVHDDDMGIGMGKAPGPVTEACVQRIELKPLDKLGDGSFFFLNENVVVEAQRQNSYGDTEEKRDAMAPPGLQQLVDVENAAPLPEPAAGLCRRP